jgi:predicted alpha/beta superfamily hydrolase
MRFVLVVGVALMSKVGAVVLAQGLTRVSIPNTEYREFTSQATRRPYAVFVALPDSYQSDPTKRYPVVYVTDAHIEFALTTYIYRLMRLTNDVPELIIVGIDGTDPNTWKAARFLDLTPTRNEAREAEVSKSLGQQVRSGDAGGFARVLTNELFPDVAKRYRVTDDRTLVGHSLGGLFGANILFQAPDAFRRMILISPALYWDDAVTFKNEEKYAAAGRVLRTHVFMAAGGLESASMLANVKRLASVFTDRKYEGFVLHSHVFADETHTSVGPAAIARGLRVLFATQVSK